MTNENEQHENWHSDWNINLIKGFKSYFPSDENCIGVSLKSIQTHQKSPERIVVIGHFSFKDRSYVGFFELCDDFVCGEIHLIKELLPQSDSLIQIKGVGFVSVPEGSYKVVSDYCGAICEADVLTAAKSTEQVIQEDDFKKGDDGNETSPLDPLPPQKPEGIIPMDDDPNVVYPRRQDHKKYKQTTKIRDEEESFASLYL
jgi:hypothetical protein